MISIHSRFHNLCLNSFQIQFQQVLDIGVDLAGLLGGRMASAEGGSVSSGVTYGEGCPLSSRLRGLGERRKLPQRGPGWNPGRKRILAYFEGHRTLIFCTYMTKSGGTICISVPAPNSGRTCPPCPPVIYAHGFRTKKLFDKQTDSLTHSFIDIYANW